MLGFSRRISLRWTVFSTVKEKGDPTFPSLSLGVHTHISWWDTSSLEGMYIISFPTGSTIDVLEHFLYQAHSLCAKEQYSLLTKGTRGIPTQGDWSMKGRLIDTMVGGFIMTGTFSEPINRTEPSSHARWLMHIVSTTFEAPARLGFSSAIFVLVVALVRDILLLSFLRILCSFLLNTSYTNYMYILEVSGESFTGQLWVIVLLSGVGDF